MFESIGVLHIHSVFSDGSGTVPEIAEFARELNLDFLLLSDHNTLRALKEGYEKFYGNTFLLVGCEINDKENKNHYLAVGIDQTLSTRIPAAEYVRKVKEMGGIGFLAHPHESRDTMPEHPPYPWTDWSTDDYTGIEIWNHMSEWMENLTEQNKYHSFLHPLKSIAAPNPETLKLWDRENKKRKVGGIGGADAHAHKQNVFGFFEVEVFPYKVLFKSIRTHIFTPEKIVPSDTPEGVRKAKSQIMEALAHGRCFVTNSYHGEAAGFRFVAMADGNIYNMGDEVPFESQVHLKVMLPGIPGEIRFIRNGELVHTQEGLETEFLVMEPGTYRVEVSVNGKAWIFSNHIRIGNF